MKKYCVVIAALLFITMNLKAQNVGISNLNPVYKLDVLADSSLSMRIRNNTSTLGAQTLLRFTTSTSNSTNASTAFIGGERTLDIFSSAGSHLVFGTSYGFSPPEEHMRITEGGFVGIGTITPQGKLHVDLSTTGGLPDAIVVNDDASATIRLQNGGNDKGFLQATGDNIRIGTNTTNTLGKFIIRTDGVDRMTVIHEGRVGIGASDPVSKLHIMGGSDVSLSNNGYLMLGDENGINIAIDNNEIQAREIGTSANLFLQNSGGNVYIGDESNFTGSHRLGVDGNAVITGALRIGSNTTPAGFKLAVDGKAICTELLVRLVPWPDYVFDAGYKLPQLGELEKYIRDNKHLPGIPSAKLIEANGLNIGDMQRMQMEKIEELTLYIIQLKKEIDALKKVKPEVKQ